LAEDLKEVAHFIAQYDLYDRLNHRQEEELRAFEQRRDELKKKLIAMEIREKGIMPSPPKYLSQLAQDFNDATG